MKWGILHYIKKLVSDNNYFELGMCWEKETFVDLLAKMVNLQSTLSIFSSTPLYQSNRVLVFSWENKTLVDLLTRMVNLHSKFSNLFSTQLNQSNWVVLYLPMLLAIFKSIDKMRKTYNTLKIMQTTTPLVWNNIISKIPTINSP